MAHSKVLAPYPTELDVTAFLTDAIAFFRGTADKARVVHDAYECLGYGLGKYIPDESGDIPLRMGSSGVLAAKDDNETALFIETALANVPRGAASEAFNWNALVSLAVQVAIKIINKWLGL